MSQSLYLVAMPLLIAALFGCGHVDQAPNPLASEAASVEDLASQQIAKLRMEQAQQARFLQSLATTVSEEPRNDVWSKNKENRLRQSFAHIGTMPENALRQIDCRNSRCALLVEVPSERASGSQIQQLSAIDEWIAWSQPCAYTMLEDPKQNPAGTTLLHIFLACDA